MALRAWLQLKSWSWSWFHFHRLLILLCLHLLLPDVMGGKLSAESHGGTRPIRSDTNLDNIFINTIKQGVMITKLHKTCYFFDGKRFPTSSEKNFWPFSAVVAVILGISVGMSFPSVVTFVRMALFDINFLVRSCLMRVHTLIIVSSMTVHPVWLAPFALCCSVPFAPSFVRKLFETKFLNFNLYIIKVLSL